MNTVQKNFSIVEGSKSRMIVRMDESLDLDTFEVYAGNEKCKCRMMKYHEVSKEDHIITLISDPAPSNVQSIPYQIFIKDTSTNIEWLVVSGNISIITRYVGAPGDSTIEINPPLDEEVIDIDVEVTYTKADLDEAVRQAREAAGNAYTYAQDAGSSAGLSWLYAQCAHRAVSDIGSSVESAWSAAGKSQEWSELAEQYALCAQHYVRDACNYANSAEGYMYQACAYANSAASSADSACEYSCKAACYMHKTCEYLDEVTGIAATKQDLLNWDELPVEDSDNPVRSSGVFLLTSFPEYGDDRWHPCADCGMPQNFLYQTEVNTGGELDLSDLTVGKLATAEMWIDYHGGSVVWPNNWYWIDAVNEQYCYPPMRCCMAESTRYAISARNDGYKTVANVQYNYPLN